MQTTTPFSHELSQVPGLVKQVPPHGPVIITDRGRPTVSAQAGPFRPVADSSRA